jgi:hypothetical protein
VETLWVHLPPGLQPIGNKETTWPSAPPPPMSTYLSHFLFIYPKPGGLIKLKNDLEMYPKKCKALCGSSLFALSNYTTFSQTQTCATVPLMLVYIDLSKKV